tara:strand:+ start:206 stop:844 length:639 start_codon:yes stop_codon:yes gene_type:complete
VSKPKASEYKASESEKATASVGLHEKKFFREEYIPKLKEMRDTSEKQDYTGVAEGKANADTMQALTNRPALAATRSVDATADLASAATGQAANAYFQGTVGKKEDQLGVLKNARGLANTATSGLSRAGKIETSNLLASATAKQTRRNAQIKAGGRLSSQGVTKFASNLSDANAFEQAETKRGNEKGVEYKSAEQGSFFQKGFGGIDVEGRYG